MSLREGSDRSPTARGTVGDTTAMLDWLTDLPPGSLCRYRPPSPVGDCFLADLNRRWEGGVGKQGKRAALWQPHVASSVSQERPRKPSAEPDPVVQRVQNLRCGSPGCGLPQPGHGGPSESWFNLWRSPSCSGKRSVAWKIWSISLCIKGVKCSNGVGDAPERSPNRAHPKRRLGTSGDLWSTSVLSFAYAWSIIRAL